MKQYTCERCNSQVQGSKYGNPRFCKVCRPIAYKERRGKWAEANRERLRAAGKRSYQRNKDKILAKHAAYRKANPEKFAEYTRRSKARNPDAYAERLRVWYGKNGRNRIHNQRRRAREKGAAGTFTDRQWKEQLESQGYRCFDCGVEAPLTIGHLVPLSRGGSNFIENIVGQCLPCNLQQGVTIHQSVAA